MAKWQRAGGAILALTVALSPAGYRALKSHEGLGQPGASVQKAYADPYYGWRIATICYGHTGPDVHAGDNHTDAECKAILERDLEKSWAAIDQYVTVETDPWVRAAAADFALNVGVEAFRRSSFVRLLNQGRVHEACNSLLLWTRAGPQKNVQGLIRRRQAERHLCLGEPW